VFTYFSYIGMLQQHMGFVSVYFNLDRYREYTMWNTYRHCVAETEMVFVRLSLEWLKSWNTYPASPEGK